MALHIRHDLGGSDQTVGFVIGTFSVVALGSRTFAAGLMASRFGYSSAFLLALGGVVVAAAVWWRVFKKADAA